MFNQEKSCIITTAMVHITGMAVKGNKYVLQSLQKKMMHEGAASQKSENIHCIGKCLIINNIELIVCSLTKLIWASGFDLMRMSRLKES